mmetsp:Transcript_5098/g.14186  ORF Transcript_5098/g.14186 Transcript_5098/m.14186 type:complete len:265 (+) Transcript_5098:504-1298(+)
MGRVCSRLSARCKTRRAASPPTRAASATCASSSARRRSSRCCAAAPSAQRAAAVSPSRTLLGPFSDPSCRCRASEQRHRRRAGDAVRPRVARVRRRLRARTWAGVARRIHFHRSRRPRADGDPSPPAAAAEDGAVVRRAAGGGLPGPAKQGRGHVLLLLDRRLPRATRRGDPAAAGRAERILPLVPVCAPDVWRDRKAPGHAAGPAPHPLRPLRPVSRRRRRAGAPRAAAGHHCAGGCASARLRGGGRVPDLRRGDDGVGRIAA